MKRSRIFILTGIFLGGVLSYGHFANSQGTSVTADPSNFPGLDPTGVSNSTSALQAAFNAASGRSLVLPQGVYTVTSLNLPKDGIIFSATGAKLVLSPDSKDGKPILRIPSAAANIEIDGLEIDGQSGSLPQFKKISGIVSSGHVDHVIIKNLFIHDISQSAVELSNGDANWELANNRIERTGRHGIVVDYVTEQAHDLYIHDNRIEYCGFSPISIIAEKSDDQASAGATNVRISKNYVSHNGLDINGYSPNNRNITITENTIENNGIKNKMGHAIHFAGTNIIITKNIARNTAISAIVISGCPNSNPTPVEDFDISDNTIENILSEKNSKGILVQNASSGRISGNTVSGTQECPIDVTGNALGHGGPRIHDIEISGNTITNSPDMGDNGICVSNADNITVKDNSFNS